MIDGPLQELATKGVLGLLLVLSLVALWWKDKQLAMSVEQRFADNAEGYERMATMQELVNKANDSSTRLVEEFEKLRERENVRDVKEAAREAREAARDASDTGSHRRPAR